MAFTFKNSSSIGCLLLSAWLLAACSTNPATGKQQFAGLMPASQETQIGASEHEKVEAQFGFYKDSKVQNYVSAVGAKIAANTERPDVQYKFFVIDSPVVNAFALPGGYVYVSRGILALANSEAELAAVLAHETGHITARHSAERYSHGVLTSIGASVISAAVGEQAVTQALGVGSNLYLSSYSRGQESEADSLGLRYMSRAGYDTAAMSSFLASLQAQTALDSQMKGENAPAFSYFSTHPATGERVSATANEARNYQPGGNDGHERHLSMIAGMTYGDSPEQGLVRGQTFYHPDMGFAFSVPNGFRINNTPDKIVATSSAGAVIIFDVMRNTGQDAATYLAQGWAGGEPPAAPLERINIGGMPAATAAYAGTVNGQPMQIRLVAIEWKGNFARFQVAMPTNAGAGLVDALKTATYSFHNMSDAERSSVRPQRVKVVTARAGESPGALGASQPFGNYNEAQFRVLNGLAPGQGLQSGRQYKTVGE